MSSDHQDFPPFGQPGNRRNFLKRSAAASIIASTPLIFSGLIRAAANEPDPEQTTVDPWETTVDPWETTAAPYDSTTISTGDTTVDPWETTEATTAATTEETTDYYTAGPVQKEISKEIYTQKMWSVTSNTNTYSWTSDQSQGTAGNSHPTAGGEPSVTDPALGSVKIAGETFSNPTPEREHVPNGKSPKAVLGDVSWGNWTKDTASNKWFRIGTIEVIWEYK